MSKDYDNVYAFGQYQEDAMKTLNRKLDYKDKLLMAVLGASSESGEASDLVKKHFFHDHPLDKKALLKEAGDLLWYVTCLCEVLDTDLEQVAIENIAKLQKRYEGEFSSEKSINRKDVYEKEVENSHD